MENDPAANAERVPVFLVATLLVAALLFGGGSRGTGDAVVILVAMPVAFYACLRWSWGVQEALPKFAAILLFSVMAWHVLQLAPLPGEWIIHLPMRPQIIADMEAARVKPAWLPATLDKWGTARSLAGWLVFSALLALISTFSTDARLRLLKLTVLLGGVMALLGYAQAAAGRHSLLRLYEYHHAIGAIGTFANRNHFASLMAMLAPLSLGLAAYNGKTRRLEAVLWYCAAMVLLLAAGLSFSRTGFLLACAATVAMLLALSRRRLAVTGALFASSCSAWLISIYAWGGLSSRLEQDPLKDLRWQYLAYGWQTAKAYAPWGSGPGSFRYVYAPIEPITKMGTLYALHAHNELIEFAVEWGVFGAFFVSAAIALLGLAMRNKLIVAGGRSPIMVGSAVAVLVPMLHSLVDYPLRTYAVMAVLTVPLSLLLSGKQGTPNGGA